MNKRPVTDVEHEQRWSIKSSQRLQGVAHFAFWILPASWQHSCVLQVRGKVMDQLTVNIRAKNDCCGGRFRPINIDIQFCNQLLLALRNVYLNIGLLHTTKSRNDYWSAHLHAVKSVFIPKNVRPKSGSMQLDPESVGADLLLRSVRSFISLLQVKDRFRTETTRHLMDFDLLPFRALSRPFLLW